MASWKEQLQPIRDLRNSRDQLDETVYGEGLQLQRKNEALQKAMQQPSDGGGTIRQLQQAIAVLQGSYDQDKAQLSAARDSLQQAIGTLYTPGPQQLIGEMDDTIPFVLLPVRIETRFQTTNPKDPELWLRIYPDDIAIHTHEEVLTDNEVTAGIAYWIALFQPFKSGGANAEDQKKAAWDLLVAQFGAPRSAWVARQTKPTNWTDGLAGISDAGQLVFPVFDLTKTQAWSRAPRTKVLPDKFVVMLYTGTTKVKEITGNLVPDDLIVGPDPGNADSFVKSGNQLNFGTDFDWASDFDRAIALGMGFKIPLSAAEAKSGFDMILVLGLYASGDETQGQKVFQELMDNHHYSAQGFGLLPTGTATNNTDTRGSGFSATDPFNQRSYHAETGDPLFTAADDCDGKNLADALGIDYATLERIGGSDSTDNKEAVEMNQALYAGTLGYYAGTLMAPVFNENAQGWLRDFFCGYVTGRGPLPAFRVSKQPYGVLLTSDFSAWKEQQERVAGQPGMDSSTFPETFLSALYKVLADYQAIWLSLKDQLFYAGMPGQDPDKVLLNILGLQPGAAGFSQRNAYSAEDLLNLSSFQFGGKYFADAQANFSSKNEGLNWLQSMGFNVVNRDGTLAIPPILRLIYQHYNTALDPTNLVDKVPLSETDPVRDYNPALKANYLDWLAAATSVSQLELQDFGTGVTPPNALLYLLLRRALLLELSVASVNWFGNLGLDFSPVMAATDAHNIRPEGTLTKWEVMKAPVGTAAPGHPQKAMAVAEYLLGPGKTESQAALLDEMRAALSDLAGKPTARLERCFTEHLDTLTYRLDSWQTALFQVRLQKIRNSGANANGQTAPRKGLYLGAYGWLEDIRPSARTIVAPGLIPQPLEPAGNQPVYHYDDNGGFVHAPSINHAAAAAVLRSGYLSHASAANPDAMSVDLSSERVRRALLILEGMRNGQQVEALLGYQFESGLHDRASADKSLLRVNEYIYNFRDAFAIMQNLVQQQGTGPQQTIPANDVVNGLTLSASTLAFPYGATGDVLSASAPEQAAIEAEKAKLADTLDAVNDLLTSESVYQLALGNIDRAGATLNALKDGHVPPQLDIIDTPRSSHFSFTNRVVIQFANGDPGDAANNPWQPIPLTARAILETGQNKWLQSLLGDANKLFVRVSQVDATGIETGTLDLAVAEIGLQPIDLVYLTGVDQGTGEPQAGKENKTGASELESRIAYAYRKKSGIGDGPALHIEFLQPQGQPGKRPLGQLLALLRTLKSMMTDSRYLDAGDFNPSPQVSPPDPNNPKGYDAAELLARITTMQAAFLQSLEAVRAIPVNASVTDSQGNTTVYFNLGDSFAALDAAGLNFAGISVDLAGADALTLQTRLIALANQGWGDAFPQVSVTGTTAANLVLLEQARSAMGRMQTASDQATTLLAQAAPLTDITKKIQALVAAGQAILGQDFAILPLFSYNNEKDILASDADRSQLLSYAGSELNMTFPADEWMQQAAHVRPRLARWDYIRMLTEAAGMPLELRPVQIPYRAKDSWIAVEYPQTDPQDPTQPFTVTQDTLSVTIHGAQAFAPGTAHCGLLVDDWAEAIPVNEEITGISFNYNQPNAFPPQAVLLAVAPALKGQWIWDELTGILTDTLLRAKLRAVDPDLLASANKVECGVLLPALLSNFSQWDLDISLDYRLNLNYVAETLPTMPIVETIQN